VSQGVDRRRPGPDRRRATLRALVVGSFARRRLGPRREADRSFAAVDWHHPQWLAVSILILLLSCADAFLTLTLINLGAQEINPFMKPLVTGNGRGFALTKLLLTAGGVIVLTLLARFRVFGRLPIGWLLYGVFGIYVMLIAYEIWLLEHLSAQIAAL
jgi:hypothetical protein